MTVTWQEDAPKGWKVVAVSPTGDTFEDFAHVGHATGWIYRDRSDAETFGVWLADSRPEEHEGFTFSAEAVR